MSKTDKTAPFNVKLRRGDLATDEYHDHRNGVCELKSDPRRVEFTPGGCYRVFHYTGIQVCSCPMCHAVDYERTETQRRRRERRTAKQTRQTAWLDEYETDPEVVVPDDECPRDNRPCPTDTRGCCTAFFDERLREALTEIREYYSGLGYEDVNDGPSIGRVRNEEVS